jgi:kinesin family protein 11
MTQQAELAGLTGFNLFEKALLSVGSILEAVVKDANEHIVKESKGAEEAGSLTTKMIATENVRLREQNERLLWLLDQERLKSEEAKGQLLEKVSGLLGEFTKERDRSLQEVFVQVKRGNDAVAGNLDAFERDYGSIAAGITSSRNNLRESLAQRTKEQKRSHDEAFSVGSTFNNFHMTEPFSRQGKKLVAP